MYNPQIGLLLAEEFHDHQDVCQGKVQGYTTYPQYASIYLKEEKMERHLTRWPSVP
jgi:hypothetical protein